MFMVMQFVKFSGDFKPRSF